MPFESPEKDQFGRQPKAVTITITEGDGVDRYDMFTLLMTKFKYESASFDFEMKADSIKIFSHPLAVND